MKEIKPNKAEKFKNLGNELFKSEEYDEALLYYNRAIELDPNILYFANRAACYL